MVAKVSAMVLISMAIMAAQAQQPAQQQPKSVCNQDITGTGQGDLDAIRGCKQFYGSITMDSPPVDRLTLDGVEQITGNVLIKGSSSLRSFSAPNLKSVQGALTIREHTALQQLDLPVLQEATSLTLGVLPELEKIDFPAGLSKVQDLTIEDTRASVIGGLKLDSLNKFTLTENNLMNSFDFPVKEVTGELYVVGNGNNMEFKASELASLQTGTFRNLGTINLSGLSHVVSDISFHQNEFTSLHLDNLQDIGGTVTIANNNKLSETSMKQLSLIGGALSVGNNTQLTSISGYPKLSAVHGTVDLAGGFDTYELPALQDVRGGMRIQTTSAKFPCPDAEKKFKASSVVKGSIWGCKSNMDANNMDPTIGQGGGGSAGGPTGGMTNKKQNGKSGSSDSTIAQSGATTTATVSMIQGAYLAVAAGLAFTFGL
ncbi:hypothetical protein BDB00DRAFT_836313 [Zychaea mexicana]|uniref:uncharacterized protein n=1 Tax=Zychaea mexicana TaxID=64656 RepID=UPI0022FE807E|nr:uncharacterized protein BDB00DRAFT_836313 [Zychaea mexicana]KAI9490842.1 hypothetical protein BDB00DRAFT_836313 [Zychaea mexicana]